MAAGGIRHGYLFACRTVVHGLQVEGEAGMSDKKEVKLGDKWVIRCEFNRPVLTPEQERRAYEFLARMVAERFLLRKQDGENR